MANKYILKKMARVHYTKGPENTRNCRKSAKGTTYGLLDNDPEEHPIIQRPMIKIRIDGENIFVPHELITYFYSLEDVESYAKESNIFLQFGS